MHDPDPRTEFERDADVAGTLYPRIRAALEQQLADAERREHGDAFRRADDHPDAAQFVADALGIELTDAQRLILTDSSGNRLTLGKPVPRDRSHDVTQSVRGASPGLVVHDEAPTFRGRLVDPEPELIADGDGNPLTAGFRDELHAQLRLRAEFYHGTAIHRGDAIVRIPPG